MNHEILLLKLETIKLSEQIFQWFRPYYCYQIFLIQTESKLSDFGTTSCGVLQGSISQPLLFSIYSNDMPPVLISKFTLVC